MKILITGAASFLGRHLVEYFHKKGDEVLALVRENARGIKHLLKYSDNFKLIVLDMRDIERLNEDFDICIHLAWGGIGKIGRMDKNIQNENIENTISLMKACKRNGGRRMLFAGSQAEYGQTLEDISANFGEEFDVLKLPLQDENFPTNPKSRYGRAKLFLKTELKELGDLLGIQYVHMRIFSVFGEGDHKTSLISSCLNNFLNNEDIYIGECMQSWNYIYIRDLCEAVDLLTKHELRGEYVFNIAGDENRILMDYVKNIKKILKSKSNIIIEKRKASGEGIPFLNPSIKRLKHLGFKEVYGFERGIEDMVSQIKASKK